MASELLGELLSPDELTYRRFLVGWFGPHRPEFGLPLDPPTPPLPTALRRFHEYAGDWPGVFGFNQLYPPSETWVDPSGRLLFCSENQGVCVWGTEPDGDDPPVDVKGSIELDPDGREWHREGEPLSRFLLQLVLFEAAMGARLGGYALAQPGAACDHILEPLTALPLAAWEWPTRDSRFWAGDDVVALVSPNPGHDTHDVLIGARSATALSYLRDLPPATRTALVLRDS